MIKLTDKEFSEFAAMVHSRFGINLAKKRILIEGRLSNTLREKNLSSFDQYLSLLKNDQSGSEITQLLNRITTNHTFFMRENEHFEFLLHKVLPYFEKNHPDRDLRIWSAGCSSGQEPYTIAMAMDEYFGSKKHLWDTTILATDISMSVLEKGKRAVYPAESLEMIPDKWRNKYFIDLKDGTFQIGSQLRNEVVFKPFNLMDPFVFKKNFDLIFCRNVMIYFDEDTKERLVSKFHQWTAKGGFLFIGHSEVLNRTATQYHYVKPAVYQKGV